MIFVAFVSERYETDDDIEGGEVELFGPFDYETEASAWAYAEASNFSSTRSFWRIVNTKKVYLGNERIERDRQLSKLMLQMPREWRSHWCGGQACACMGCANLSGNLTENGFQKHEWEEWIKANPKLVKRK
jgi:hypothetical protein